MRNIFLQKQEHSDYHTVHTANEDGTHGIPDAPVPAYLLRYSVHYRLHLLFPVTTDAWLKICSILLPAVNAATA